MCFFLHWCFPYTKPSRDKRKSNSIMLCKTVYSVKKKKISMITCFNRLAFILASSSLSVPLSRLCDSPSGALSHSSALARSHALPIDVAFPLLLVSRWRCYGPLASPTSQVIAVAATVSRPDRAKELVVHEVYQVQRLVHLHVGSDSCVQERHIKCLGAYCLDCHVLIWRCFSVKVLAMR